MTAVTHAASALAGIHTATNGQTKRNRVRHGESETKAVDACQRVVPAVTSKHSCRESAKRLQWQVVSVETYHIATFDFVRTCVYDRCQMKVTASARGGKEQTGTVRTSAKEDCRCVEGGFQGWTVHAERWQQIHITQLCDCEQPWASARPLCACTQRITGARPNHERVRAEMSTGSFAAAMGGRGAQGGRGIEQLYKGEPSKGRGCPGTYLSSCTGLRRRGCLPADGVPMSASKMSLLRSFVQDAPPPPLERAAGVHRGNS